MRRHNFQPQLRVRSQHISEAEPLMVKRISFMEIAQFWMPHHVTKKVAKDSAYYVQCNKAGNVTYEEAAIFTSRELVGRNNVTQILQE